VSTLPDAGYELHGSPAITADTGVKVTVTQALIRPSEAA
jgi:hypothetical protein